MLKIKRVWPIAPPADLKDKPKQKLKSIYAHPKVVSKDRLTSGMCWVVS